MKPHNPDHILNSALALAADIGWRDVSLAGVAERASVGLPQVVEHFPTKTALLTAYARRVDDAMLAGPVDTSDANRDRLFDVIMRRFDAMASDREALRSIMRDGGGDPWALACGARYLMRSMGLTLEAAGISSTGLTGVARRQGLAAIYLYAFKAFLDDDSEDLSHTMAVLDKALRRAEGLAASLCRGGLRHDQPAATSS